MKELKTLTQNIKQILGVESASEISKVIMRSMMSDRRTLLFERYIELVEGDLSIDYLQKIYQFWEADRSEKKQDFTPQTVADLAASLTSKPNHYMLYDFCAGSGALTLAHWRRSADIEVLCEELDERVIPLLIFNLSVRNISGYVVNKDVLTGEIFRTYRLTSGEKYSEVRLSDPPSKAMYDAVVSNPPFNITWTPVIDERFAVCEETLSKLKRNANYAFVLHALSYLKEDGKAALILPNGCLSSAPEQKIRAYLCEEGKLDAVIAMPNNMFESTGIPTCILALKASKDYSGIELVDARNSCGQKIRHQRGEGDASHTSRIYHKTLNVFTQEQISKISSAAADKTEIPGFSSFAALEKVRVNEYNIQPGRYVQSAAEEKQTRPLEDIVADINKIVKERNAFKITMNEGVARQFGLYDLAERLKESNKITDDMNEKHAPLGFKFEKSDYFMLSKNAKEIKLENKNKEEISSIFMILLPMIIPMYKQHIFYLNNRENELLAELRDALLPKLMSGEITLEASC